RRAERPFYGDTTGACAQAMPARTDRVPSIRLRSTPGERSAGTLLASGEAGRRATDEAGLEHEAEDRPRGPPRPRGVGRADPRRARGARGRRERPDPVPRVRFVV